MFNHQMTPPKTLHPQIFRIQSQALWKIPTVLSCLEISGEKLDHIHTPDPIMLEIEQLRLRMVELEAKLEKLK